MGRSSGNYRLFDEEALWCVAMIGTLRRLGLTLAEIGDLAASYLQRPGEPVGPQLAEVLGAVRARTENRIAELDGREQLVFLAVLAIGLVFEATWYLVHHSNAVTPAQTGPAPGSAAQQQE